MYLVSWSGGSVGFPVEGLEDALKSPHPHSRERAASLLRNSLQLAEEHAARLRSEGHITTIIRAGRQSDAKGLHSRRLKKRFATRVNNAGELYTSDTAWELPEGFVDTEEDKHGPKIQVPVSQLTPLRSAVEKAAWFAKYGMPDNKTCLWQ
jgi:hypothetical protein